MLFISNYIINSTDNSSSSCRLSVTQLHHFITQFVHSVIVSELQQNVVIEMYLIFYR